MEKIKKYIKPMIFFYGIMIIYLIVISLFDYFDIISYKSISVINFIIIMLLFMMSGFLVALKSNKKGYISGMAIGITNIILFIILSLILGSTIKTSSIIYYFILLICSVIGGMFGINYDKEK